MHKVVMSCLMLLFCVCTQAQQKMLMDSTVEIKMIKTIDPATGKEIVKADTVRTGTMKPDDGKIGIGARTEIRVFKTIDPATGKEVVKTDTIRIGGFPSMNNIIPPPVEMADQFRKDGKIYVVVGVCLIVLLSMLLYMFSLDRKVRKLEELTKR
jgi:hypothetical protein